MALSGCHRQPKLQLRTDVDPLVKRLKLPTRPETVRWVAVSPNKDSGWIPPKTEFYTVYAYIELDDQSWAALSKTVGEPTARDTISLPRPVAEVLIPAAAMKTARQSDPDVQIDGTALNTSALPTDPKKTEVQKAIRLDKDLFLEFIAR